MDHTFWGWVVAHVFGAGTIAATIAGVFPPIAAFFAFLFYMVQLWESSTVQHYVRNKRMVWKARKVARLRAKEKVITAQLEALEVVRQARTEAKELVATAAAEAEKLKVKEETDRQVSLPPV